MMLEFGFAPKHIPNFLKVYKDIYDKRVKAKAEKDKFTANSLKLVLNSSFGLMGSFYSKFYSPDTMLHVTLTGQLLLLMLIERLEKEGISVFYGNTDGITVECPNDKLDLMRSIIFDWELDTGMSMEEAHFKACYIRDVNAFVNITTDGDIKSKGVFAEPTLMKNNEYAIVFDAIKLYLRDGIAIEDTIRNCKDFRRFISGRTVSKGGYWRGDFIGKVVRFYYSTDGDQIEYKNVHGNWAKVATTEGCRPLMTLPESINGLCETPSDLDYDKYIELSYKHLKTLGV